MTQRQSAPGPSHACHAWLSWLLALAALCALTACTQPKTYDYADIKREYRSQAALASPKEFVKSEATKPLQGDPTLRSAIGRALEHNPDQEVALARIRQSEALVDEAMAPFWPAISAQASYKRGDYPGGYFMSAANQRNLVLSGDINQAGRFQNFELGLAANWNLFRGGRDLLQRRMAETGLEISRLDKGSVENALVASVIKAFYNCLAARDFETIADESMKTVAAQLKVMQVRHAAGVALKSDVLSLKVRLAQSKENKVRAANNYQLARAALANLLGAGVDAQFTPRLGDEPGQQMPRQYAQGLDAALKLRPELRQARRRVVRARMNLDRARAGYLPTLDAQGNVFMDAYVPADFDTSKANWEAGLVLNWDVFTGFSTVAQVSQAQARLGEMLAADRKAAQAVQLDVKSAYLNYKAAQVRLEVSSASVAQAEESLRLVKRQYGGGVSTVTRYLEAELAWSQARTRAAAAEYDQQKAAADIARSIGLWSRYARQEMKRSAR